MRLMPKRPTAVSMSSPVDWRNFAVEKQFRPSLKTLGNFQKPKSSKMFISILLGFSFADSQKHGFLEVPSSLFWILFSNLRQADGWNLSTNRSVADRNWRYRRRIWKPGRRPLEPGRNGIRPSGFGAETGIEILSCPADPGEGGHACETPHRQGHHHSLEKLDDRYLVLTHERPLKNPHETQSDTARSSENHHDNRGEDDDHQKGPGDRAGRVPGRQSFPESHPNQRHGT